MSMQNELVMMGMYVLGQLPVLIIWIVGIILALKNWSDYPKVAGLALIGFVTLILELIIFSFINIMLPQFLSQRGTSSSDIGFYFSALGIIRSFFGAISWGLIVAAIFTQRHKK